MPGAKRSRTGATISRTQTINPYRRKRRSARVSVPRNKLGFPNSMRTTLRYVERFDVEPTSTSSTVTSFRGNGLYDPRMAVGGHQPRGFDDYMELYGKFTCPGAKIAINAMYEGYTGPSGKDSTGHAEQTIVSASDAPAVPPVCVFIRKSADPLSSGTTFMKTLETDRTVWTFLSPQGETKVLRLKGNTKEFFGKEYQVGAEGYFGTDSADPTNQWQFQLGVARGSDDYPTGNCKVSILVTLEYDVVFTEPKPLSDS